MYEVIFEQYIYCNCGLSVHILFGATVYLWK